MLAVHRNLRVYVCAVNVLCVCVCACVRDVMRARNVRVCVRDVRA